MLTVTSREALYADLTNNDTTANLSEARLIMNEYDRQLTRKEDWYFLYTSGTATTAVDQQFYDIPQRIGQLSNVYITSGSTNYIPDEITSRDDWNRLNQDTNSATYPQYFIVEKNRVGFWPVSSGSTQVVTIEGKKKFKDLGIADYTTGTITAITTGSTSVTASGSSWHNGMAGRFFRATEADSASSGDGYWYEVESVTSGTQLVLVQPYQGVTVTGSVNYIIGQAPDYPEEFHMLPVYWASHIFWEKNGNPTRAALYKGKHDELYNEMVETFGRASTNPVIDSGEDRDIVNPNLTLQL